MVTPRVLTILLATACLPTVVAEPSTFPVNFKVDNEGTVNVGGAMELQVALDGLTFDERHGPSQLTLEGQGRIRVIHERQVGAWYEDLGPWDGNYSDFADHTEYVGVDYAFDGTVGIQAEESVVNVLPYHEKATFSLAFNATEIVLEQTVTDQTAYRPKLGSGLRSRWYFVGPSMATIGLPETVEARVSVCVAAYAADVSITESNGTRDVPNGWTLVVGVPGPNGAALYENVWVLACVEHGTLALTNGPAWAMHVARLSGSVQGMVSLTDAHGFRGTPQWDAGNASLLQVEGLFDVSADYDGGRQSWSIQGAGTFFGVDGQAVVGTKGVPWPTVAAVSGGLGILAFLLWLLRGALADGLASLVGYTRADPVANPTRMRLLALVEGRPGITVTTLAAALGVRRPAVMFHAKVLQKAGHVVVRRRGRSQHLLPGRGRYDLDAIACLQHPLRRALLRRLEEIQPATVAQLRRDLHADATHRLVAYHLEGLSEAGLVSSTWRGRVRVYAAKGCPVQ